MTIRAGFLLLLTTSLVMAGCSQQGSGSDTEQLLAAEGTWHLVEDKAAPSPAQQHMSARGQVNPAKPYSPRNYTSKPSASDMNESVHFRVLRLESQMAGLQGDFDKLLPPLSGLVAADQRLDKTIHEIQTRDRSAMAVPPNMHIRPPHKPSAQVPKKAAVSAPPPRMTEKPARVEPASGAPTVTSVRMGEHPGKTRIVLDVNAPAEFRYDLDNNEHLLLVDLPGAGWSAATQKNLTKHPLVKGYTAQQSGSGGTILAVELQKDARIVMSTAMKPNNVHGHRVVFDIAAQ